MSYYRVCKIKNEQKETIDFKKFDNKEDAEHYAKNQSLIDGEHNYEIQKNENGDFIAIKAYFKGNLITTI